MSHDTLTLLHNEQLRRAFGDKGREMAVQRYSTEQIIPHYISFYEKIISKAQAAATA
jgi:glycosyltransferase involved in cell wall biosynthesis